MKNKKIIFGIIAVIVIILDTKQKNRRKSKTDVNRIYNINKW